MNFSNPILDRLVKGAAAAGAEQVCNVVIQLVSVPLYLYCWGVDLYGEWILLYTFPSYIAVSDLGFTKAAVNSMTISVAEKNYIKANQYYHTTFVLLIALGGITITTIILCMLGLESVNRWLNLNIISNREVFKILLLLTVYVSLFQQAELLRGILSSSGRFALSMSLVAVYRFFEFLIIVTLLLLGFGPVAVSACYVAVQLVKISHLAILIKYKYRWLELGISSTLGHSSQQAAKEMLKPAFAFLLLPIGFATRTQFPIFLIGTILSPAAIVVFSTTRTITNVGTQIIGVVNKAITPEYALAYGSGNMKLVKLIHHKSCNLAFVLSVFLSALLLVFGKLILQFWTHGEVQPNQLLFFTLLLSLITSSLWSTSSFLSYSINQHAKQSVLFLLSCVVSSMFTYFFLKYFGLSAAAVGLLVGDVVMMYYTFKINKKILDESASAFIGSIFRFPSLATLKSL